MAESPAMGTPSLKLSDNTGMVLFRGELKSKTLQEGLFEVTKVKVPAKGRINSLDGLSIAWMSPDELLIFLPLGDVGKLIDALDDKLEGEETLIWDVSDLRSVFQIEGHFIREVLAKNSPADLNRDKMRRGTFRRTRFGQVAVAFWFKEETCWFLICRRSEAGYIQRLFEVSTQEGEIPSFY